jgi:hypothetical protein
MNGVLKNIQTQTGVLGAANTTVRIGGYFNNNYYFSGSVSQFQVYNRALSASEVLQNYNASKSRFNLT